jgi:predicted Zn-dependent protease
MIRIILAFAIISMGLSCARNPVTGKKEFSLMSEGQEKQLGAESDPAVIAEYGLYEDQKLQDFINAKGLEMAKISHRPALDWKFRIVDSPIVNAFAVPGGYIYFTRGIMGHFNNEAEFAGVLGHELGHVTARHANEMYTRQVFTQVAMIGGMIFSETFRQFADAASQAASVLFLKYSRDNESQSDKLGVEYSTEIGYNSHEMANFFKTLEKLSSQAGKLPTFMSTHPDPGDRYNAVHAYSDQIHKAKAMDHSKLSVNRDQYLRMIEGLVHGEDPRQGYFEGGSFYHPELKFQFKVPANWQKLNSPSKVQMGPQDGKAMMSLEVAQGADPGTAAQKFVQNNGVNVLESSQNPINGLPAVSIYGDVVQQGQNGQQGQTLSLMVSFIKYGNLVYQLLGVSLKQDFNAYSPTFRNTIGSFSALNDPSKLNRLPNRIKIVSARRNYTLQEGLQDYGMLSDKYGELAILNGMELTAPLSQGMLFKVLESRN